MTYPMLEEKLDFNWRKQILRFQCCDCGLVHDVKYIIAGRRIRVITTRNNRATGQIRRHRQITFKAIRK